MPPRPSRPNSWYLPNPTVRPTMLSNSTSPLATVAWQRRRPRRPLYVGHPPLSSQETVDLRLRMQVRSPASSQARLAMLFHVTISHRQADCPGRRPAETPDLIGPAERLEALGDEFSVTSHSLVWGASCILWAEPEHVAYALLEAPSLEAVELYIDALTPAGWETRALPVFTVPGQLDTVRQVLSQPVIPHVRPPAVVAEPVAEAEPAPEAKPAARAEAAAVAEPALEVDFADEDDTLKGLTFAQLPDVPPDTTPEPREQERPDQQVTRAMPTPVGEPSVAQAAERPDQQITREIPQPVVPAAEPPDQQITREIPQPVVPAAEPADKQITREIPQPVVPPAEPADKQVTREIPQPVAQSDRGSSPS